MVVPPAPIPVTTPPPAPGPGVITAIFVLALLHVPPEVRSVSVVFDPEQTGVTPNIGAGNGLTVTTVLVAHPVVAEVKVMVVVPPGLEELPPLTTPVAEPTVATEELLLVHVPPDELLSVVVNPAQIVVLPVIGDGSGLTLMVITAVHAFKAVYVISDVPPILPVPVPEFKPMVTLPLLLAHVPPAGASVNENPDPAQTTVGPNMAPGEGLTVITVVV